MEKNSRLFYNDVTEVYNKLLLFCAANGLKAKERGDKFYFIEAKKSSLLFWKNIRLELEIMLVDKTQVKVTCKAFRFWMRQPRAEIAFVAAIEDYINAAIE